MNLRGRTFRAFVLEAATAVALALASLVGSTKPIGAQEALASPHSAAGSRFQECADCPAMTVIPPGHYTMTRKSASDGRRDDDPEGVPKTRAAREVVIEQAFAMSLYPVTRREFAVFVRETKRKIDRGCYVQRDGVWMFDAGKDWSQPGFSQTNRDPVTCVNWDDLQDYVRWLNGKRPAGQAQPGEYRAPSWEEIEYAAGGAAATAYYWGEQPQRNQANYGAARCLPCAPEREGADRWLHTSPVGSFPPNAFGLYDMAGNVWQWAQGCRSDPTAAVPRVCRSQVLHGGSWLTNPEYLRTGEYSYTEIRHRNNQIGVRIVRTLS